MDSLTQHLCGGLVAYVGLESLVYSVVFIARLSASRQPRLAALGAGAVISVGLLAAVLLVAIAWECGQEVAPAGSALSGRSEMADVVFTMAGASLACLLSKRGRSSAG